MGGVAMFCPQCGGEYADTNAFCSKCGAKNRYVEQQQTQGPSINELEQFVSWHTQYGWLINALVTDREALNAGLIASDFDAILRASRKFKADLDVWRTYPSHPVPGVGPILSAAMSSFSAMAQHAIDGINNNDQALIDLAKKEIQECTAYFQQMKVELDRWDESLA